MRSAPGHLDNDIIENNKILHQFQFRKCITTFVQTIQNFMSIFFTHKTFLSVWRFVKQVESLSYLTSQFLLYQFIINKPINLTTLRKNSSR